MDTVTIRRARAGDKEALEEIAVAIAGDVVWVAEVGGRVAGFAVLVDEPEATLLENLAVHPDSQGSGIGRRLMAIAEDHARTTGRDTIRLYTHSTMLENRRFYSRLGYVETEQRREDEFDRVFFEKRVDQA